jgi:putative transposase
LLVDGRGVPLSFRVAGANRHDVKMLAATMDAVVVKRPPRDVTENLCLDNGYQGEAARLDIVEREYVPHVCGRGEEARRKRTGHRPRRWVVERTHSWLNRYRKPLVRFEKLSDSHEGLLEIACALTAFRQCVCIYG